MSDEKAEVIAGLIAALEWYIETDETCEGDHPLPDHHGLTWNEINREWLAGKQRAIDAISRARSS